MVEKREDKRHGCKRASDRALKMIFSRSTWTLRNIQHLVTVLWAIYLANVNARFTEPPPVIQPLGLLRRASWHPERNLYRHVIPTSTARRNPEGRRRRGRAFLSSPRCATVALNTACQVGKPSS